MPTHTLLHTPIYLLVPYFTPSFFHVPKPDLMYPPFFCCTDLPGRTRLFPTTGILEGYGASTGKFEFQLSSSACL
jgi:hypothetical protein